jgi:hypothetical protein
VVKLQESRKKDILVTNRPSSQTYLKKREPKAPFFLCLHFQVFTSQWVELIGHGVQTITAKFKFELKLLKWKGLPNHLQITMD